MIEVKNVTRVYGKNGKKSSAFQALKGVSFQIPTGATAAIIGKSGSGKSTLMHLMGGLDHPTSGDILIDGTSLSSMRRRTADRFRARDLGFVFQSFFIEAGQTCYQNVVLPLEINQIPRSKRRALVEKALEQVELFDKLKSKAGTLSGGQKQRLAIARAIVHSPRILMADEPTGNLDSATGDKVIDLLFGLNKRLQCTLIIITHDAELAARCQYQIEVKDGAIVGMRRPRPSASAKAGTGLSPVAGITVSGAPARALSHGLHAAAPPTDRPPTTPPQPQQAGAPVSPQRPARPRRIVQ